MAASSEPDSLPFFGRAAGIETARRKEKVEGRGWRVADGSTGTGAKILSNLSLIMVGPVLHWCTVWALVVDLPKDPISGPNQGPCH